MEKKNIYKKGKQHFHDAIPKVMTEVLRSSVCVLCIGTHTDGLLETDFPNVMAHRRCAIFLPECSVFGEGCNEKIVGINTIPLDRWNLKCDICKLKPVRNKKKDGACIQCAKGRCLRTYHVSCADSESILMLEADENNIARCICPQHDKNHQVLRKRKREDSILKTLFAGARVICKIKGSWYEGISTRILVESRSCNVSLLDGIYASDVKWENVKVIDDDSEILREVDETSNNFSQNNANITENEIELNISKNSDPEQLHEII
ncbi:Lysine-specific demethylase 4B [Nowakowskiella sp. JEL0078]|nr:Lysine-specific demethylase 4B [Nowakowskiella sp. JEL0078]